MGVYITKFVSSSFFNVFTFAFFLFFCCVLLQCLTGLVLAWMFFNLFDCCWFSILSFCDFEFGFFIRSCHLTFVSLVFLFMFLHFCKVFMFFLMFDFSFSVWYVGFLVFVCCVLLTFLGYVLPCTQMSYWGLTVFSNLFTAVPLFGSLLVSWFWGSDFIQDFTLLKCHILHIVLPFVFLLFVCLHLFVLHFYMSSDGFLDRFCFYCERLIFCAFVLVRDLFFCVFFCCLFVFCVLVVWFFVFHEESFILCNVLKTSDKILPEWFFLFFFGFLKSVPYKFFGLFLLFCFFVGFFCCLSFCVCYFGRLFFVFFC